MKITVLVFVFYLIALHGIFGQNRGSGAETPREIFKEQRVGQGEIIYNQAKDYFSEKHYKACIEKSLDFLVLFPKHPLHLTVLKLLSEAYFQDEQLERSIQTDFKIYREFSTTEDGLNSYLDGARKLIRMGRKPEAIEILLKIKSQMYSYKVAKDAEIELNQLKILGDYVEPAKEAVSN